MAHLLFGVHALDMQAARIWRKVWNILQSCKTNTAMHDFFFLEPPDSITRAQSYIYNTQDISVTLTLNKMNSDFDDALVPIQFRGLVVLAVALPDSLLV